MFYGYEDSETQQHSITGLLHVPMLSQSVIRQLWGNSQNILIIMHPVVGLELHKFGGDWMNKRQLTVLGAMEVWGSETAACFACLVIQLYLSHILATLDRGTFRQTCPWSFIYKRWKTSVATCERLQQIESEASHKRLYVVKVGLLLHVTRQWWNPHLINTKSSNLSSAPNKRVHTQKYCINESIPTAVTVI